MAKIKINIKNLQEFKQSLKSDSAKIKTEIKTALISVAKNVQRDAIISISQGVKSGKVYQKYNPKRTHRASAEGQAPAGDTGQLANSIELKENAGLSVEVIAQAIYAGRLEEDMNRPFLQPAIEKNEEFLRQRMQLSLDRAISNV